MVKSLVFIDSRVADHQTLLSGLSADTEWVLLDADKDGVQQMQDALVGYSGLESIQIVSHGSAGTLYLGSTVLDQGTIGAYLQGLQAIGQALTETGDLLLYGCNVAAGEAGRAFIEAVAKATGADVAASSDPTGAVAQGGDWVLEQATGGIEAAGIQGSDLSGLLAANNTAPTFMVSDGKLTTNFGSGDWDQGRGVTSVTLQTDGKILVAGTSNLNFALARYNVNGSLDTSFDTDGKLTTDFGFGDYGQSVTLQTDGKILVAGISNGNFALARYNVNGSLDTSFDTDGKLTTDFGFWDYGQSVTLQTDGKILVAGYSNGNFALARYNVNGSLDTSFDTDGKLTTDFGFGVYYGHSVSGPSVTLQTDGKILVAGTSYDDFALARYNVNGSLDTSFDTDGKLTTDFGSEDYGQSVTLQTDGKILVAGTGDHDFALARYNVNGSLDTSFDTDGKLTTDFGSEDDPYNDDGQSVTLQPDGKILVAGTSSGSFDGNFALARYHVNGTLDTSFDTDGKLTTDFGNNGHFSFDSAYDLTVQADGKVLVAGTSRTMSNGYLLEPDFALARFNANGSLDTSFSIAESTLDNRPIFTEGSIGTILDPDVQILDTQLAANGNYSGATLTLARHGGANLQDFYRAWGGNLSALNSGSYFSVNSISIGRVTSNASGSLVLTFNSNATQALVNQAMQHIAYGNTADAPPATVQIDWTFNDGNTGAQGTGGSLGVTGSTTVVINATNDNPVSADIMPDLTLATGVPFTATLPTGAFTDPDREVLSYSASMADRSGLPPWLMIDTVTGTLSGTPDPLDVGTFTLLLTARDSSGSTASDAFQLTVATPSSVINGTAGADRLVGLGGDDVLNGLAGNDTLDGGAGNDNLFGGDGADLYYLRDDGDQVKETNATSIGGMDTVYSYLAAYTLTANVENGRILATGTANLTGNALNNVLYAGVGNNVLDGSTGTDTVSYIYATAAITASLTATLGQETEGSGIDTLRNVENLTGSNYQDTLIGNSAANTLNGGTGADILMGRDGSDTYYVDNVDDYVRETNGLASTGGTDLVYSYLAAYTLGANVENGRILATGAANLTGNSLNNVLYAGVSDNVLNGGSGTDTVSYAYATAGITVSLAVATVQATGGSGSDILTAIENLTGSSFGDTLVGNGAANVIDGGLGNDSLAGGLGNDTYIINTLSDVVTEKSGEGTDLIQSAISYSLIDTDGAGANGGNVENLQLTGTASINGTGNILNNVIYANSGINSIDGGVGSDTVSYFYASTTGSTGVTLNLSVINASGQATASGISGADLVKNVENITGSNYKDTLTGNAGANVLDGGSGLDSMTGGDGSDTYYVRDVGDIVIETNAVASTGGTDHVHSYLAAYTLTANVENGRILATGTASLTGNTLNNVLYAGAGDNVLNGFSGIDTVSYQYATTSVSVSLATSAAQSTGGSGSDTLQNIDNLTGSSFHDTLIGDGNANTLNGLALNDSLNGGGGNDVLLGGDGTDLLIGGLGKDLLTGGAGNDTFDFNAVNETGLTSTTWDVISDFLSGTDKIDLSSIDANTGVALDQAFSAVVVGGTFSGAFASPGDLYFDQVAHVLYGNTDSDAAAEFAIQLTGVTTLATADFFL
jgi:uncharacterized delta-60 repeat protein